jgi:hypothetical protein
MKLFQQQMEAILEEEISRPATLFDPAPCKLISGTVQTLFLLKYKMGSARL